MQKMFTFRDTMFLILFTIVLLSSSQAQFAINSKDDGSFTINVNGKVWLQSANMFFRSGSTTYANSNKTLSTLGQPATSSGMDSIGSYSMVNYSYAADVRRVDALIKTYKTGNVAVFSQYFHDELTNTSCGNKHSVISSFPSVYLGTSDVQLGYIGYLDLFSGWDFLQVRRWSKSLIEMSGLYSGPIVLFDQSDNVIIISPYNHFMAASYFHDTVEHAFYWGIMGEVDFVPAQFQLDIIVYYSSEGINKAMRAWGKLMQDRYQRTDSFRKSDLSINYIGYYTDDGAYYYHTTEGKMNYEDTMLAIDKYYEDNNIPIRFVQYDDWFYPTAGTGYQATVTWDAKPDVFPHGLQYLYNKTQLQVLAHNRYWSSKVTYAKQNGGKFKFLMDGENSIPDDQEFWDFLFAKSKQWGLYVYEQDWLNKQSMDIRPVYSDIHFGSRWFHQMGEAAAHTGITIQICMALSRNLLAALEVPSITQSRASNDYLSKRDQHMIGITSLLLDSIGIAPYKDNFWSTSVQPGNKYNKTEPCPPLQAAVSLLSTGPVGVSDKVGYSNSTLINSLIRSDGLLLKPSRAATSIDASILQTAFGGDLGPKGEVYTTYSQIGPYTFGVILAFHMNASYDLKLSQTTFSTQVPQMVFSGLYATQTFPPKVFDDSHPLTLSGCGPNVLCLYLTSPIFKVNGQKVILTGEVGKMLPLSPARISSIDSNTYDLEITLKGSPSEVLQFGLCDANNPVICWKYNCIIGGNGYALLSVAKGTCQ